MKTLLLDTQLWDLVTDSYGNIAVASDPYSVVQDVCSAIRLFLGEYWYDTTVGVPYFERILGKTPSMGYVKAQIAAAAATVPGCTNPVVYVASFSNRTISGQVQFTDSNGNQQTAGFGTPNFQLTDNAGNPIIDSNGNPVFGSGI